MCGEPGAVAAGDGVDDGQAESVSFAVADSLGAELPEWLEEAVHFIWRYHCSGVADR